MTVEQIASRLAEYCRKKEFSLAQKELYANDAVSIEPYAIPGFEQETRGLEALMEKDRKQVLFWKLLIQWKALLPKPVLYWWLF